MFVRSRDSTCTRTFSTKDPKPFPVNLAGTAWVRARTILKDTVNNRYVATGTYFEVLNLHVVCTSTSA